MKKLTTLLLLCFVKLLVSQTATVLEHTQELIGPPTLGCCPAQAPAASDYHTVFRDDFNGTTLNIANWKTNFFWDNDRFYNETGAEPVYFGDVGENVFVEGGVLKLKVDTLIPNKSVNGKVVKYSVAQIWSYKEFKYGKFECKFKLPKGEALLPAFWMQGTNGSQDEIDIFEAFGNWDHGSDSFMQFQSASYNDGGNGLPLIRTSNGRGDNGHGQALTSNEWHVATLEWTPYFMTVKIDGNLIYENYRYYSVCLGENIPIKCPDGGEPGGACNEDKFIENLAFPDEAMRVTFWVTLQPTAEWWNRPISETGTTFPAVTEIDYIEVAQLPIGTFGDCENKKFCAYNVGGTTDDIINICSTGDFATPNKINLKGTNWENFIFSHSNNINASAIPFQISLEAPYPKNGTGWLQIQVPENANANCITQDRIIKKELKFNEMGELPEITLDGINTGQNNEYKVLEGTHIIKLESSLLPSLIKNYTIEVDGQKVDNTELHFDILGYVLKTATITITYESGCSYVHKFKIGSICNNIPYTLTLNGQNISDPTFAKNQSYELCFGNYVIALSSGTHNIQSAWESSSGINIPITITNNSITFFASTEKKLYNIAIRAASGCLELVKIGITGMCCLPGRGCNGNCVLDAFPNPASQSLMINAPTTNIDPNGNAFTPRIQTINVYNRYMQQVKRVTSLDSPTYSLDVMDIPNNDFYIVESLDQYGNACRKTVMISR